MSAAARVLDPIGRAVVRLMLRGDQRWDPAATALLVVHPSDPLAARDSKPMALLSSAAEALRSVGAAIVIVDSHGEPGTASESHFDMQPGDLSFRAKTISAFSDGRLDALLSGRGIERVILGGFATNVELDGTGRHAVECGYHVTFLSDASAAQTSQEHDAAIGVTLPRVGHRVLRTAEVLAGIERGAGHG
jgi:nicotinamidase-related amidase